VDVDDLTVQQYRELSMKRVIKICGAIYDNSDKKYHQYAIEQKRAVRKRYIVHK
jgi:hypothetical protein